MKPNDANRGVTHDLAIRDENNLVIFETPPNGTIPRVPPSPMNVDISSPPLPPWIPVEYHQWTPETKLSWHMNKEEIERRRWELMERLNRERYGMHAQMGNTGLTPPPQVPLASVVEETLQSAAPMATALVPPAAPGVGRSRPRDMFEAAPWRPQDDWTKMAQPTKKELVYTVSSDKLWGIPQNASASTPEQHIHHSSLSQYPSAYQIDARTTKPSVSSDSLWCIPQNASASAPEHQGPLHQNMHQTVSHGEMRYEPYEIGVNNKMRSHGYVGATMPSQMSHGSNQQDFADRQDTNNEAVRQLWVQNQKDIMEAHSQMMDQQTSNGLFDFGSKVTGKSEAWKPPFNGTWTSLEPTPPEPRSRTPLREEQSRYHQNKSFSISTSDLHEFDPIIFEDE